MKSKDTSTDGQEQLHLILLLQKHGIDVHELVDTVTAVKQEIESIEGYDEEGTTANDLYRRAHILEQRFLEVMYPIQDDTWPSRRWNHSMTDYIDLSGTP